MTVDAVTGVSRESYNPFEQQGKAPSISMDESIWHMDVPYNMPGFSFGGDMGFDSFGFMGMPSFMGGFGAFPMFGGMGGNYQSYWDMMNEYNQAFTNNQIKNNERQRNAELQYNAPYEDVKLAMTDLREKVQTNNQDQILGAYNDFKNAVKAMYGGTDEQVAARARTIYEQAYDVSLTEDIRNHAKGAFEQAFLQSTSGGIGVDDTTAEYNVSQITGQPIGRAQRDKKIAGHALGGTIPGGVFGAIGGGIIGSLCKKAKPLAIVGSIIGAIAGSVYAAEVGSKKYK